MKVLLVAFAFCLVISSARAGSGESFPLRKGLKVVYGYQWQNLSIDVMTGGTQVTDSGTVAYQVIDSLTASDTSQTWTVQETRHLLHRHYRVTSSTAATLDSSYWIDDSRNISLLEDLTGLHRLHGNSLVWQFPVRDTLMNIGYGRRDTSADVFRFGIAGSQIALNLYNGNSWIMDTLVLKPGQGMTSRVFQKGDASNVKNNYSLNFSLLSTSAGVGAFAGGGPSTIELDQNYPNPFNPVTTIRYALPSRTHVTLAVFNALGQQVKTLVNRIEDAGYHQVMFDGGGVASGVYYYRLEAGEYAQARKFVLVR